MSVTSANPELANAPSPRGHACPNCGSPVEEGDAFCNVCGAAQQVAEKPEARATRSIQCKNCGATITLAADERSITCPFCDSNYVVELPNQTGRQQPEFVIGFALTPQEALARFSNWLREGGLFRPGDLYLAKIEDKLRGVYLPFWSFSMLAQSRWSANIGEYWYRTETYTTMEDGKMVTKTRTVTETEWWPLAGEHQNYYSGYLVSGSRGLPQDFAERIKPFRLESLKRYQPYFLAGWLSEEYSVERDQALAFCQQEFQRWEEKNIDNFLPGDTQASLEVRTEFSDINSDLILLPVYLVTYRYGEKLYRFAINGQTGNVTGDKPLSPLRIAMAVGLVILLALGVWWFMSMHR